MTLSFTRDSYKISIHLIIELRIVMMSQNKVRTVGWLIHQMMTQSIGLNVVYSLMLNKDSTEHVST